MEGEFIGGEFRTIYLEFNEKLHKEKRLSEQDKAFLKEKKPEFYEMAESLEHEVEVYREKLKNCSSKEEVQELMDTYEDGLILGFSLVESNPVLPLEKKLEYTMFKDTKLSVMETLIREFTESARYAELPDAGGHVEENVEEELSEEEELELQRIKRARAMSSYADNRRAAEQQEALPFDAKG